MQNAFGITRRRRFRLQPGCCMRLRDSFAAIPSVHHPFSIHEQQRTVIRGLVSDDAQPYPTAEALLTVGFAVAERHLVTNFTLARHLRAIFACERDFELPSQRHRLSCLDEQTRVANVSSDSTG